MRTRLAILAAMAALIAFACASPNEPVAPDGRIVLRFENAPALVQGETPPYLAAEEFDSVVVRVFRSGPSIVQEASKGAAIPAVGPIEVSLACVAENNKRVSVELFSGRAMTYHGVNANVNVLAGQTNSVPVDVYEFVVDSLQLAPQPVVQSGTSYTLKWNKAQAATSYLVQSSAGQSFSTVDWEQTVTDTTLAYLAPAGTHFFRVVPRTAYASGRPEGPSFGYVTGSGDKVKINAIAPLRVIPGELFTIAGANLDYPGTTAQIGADDLEIVSASWDSLVVRLPRPARTNMVTVTSGNPALGSETFDKPVVALRVAYVTLTNEYAAEYVKELEGHSHDFENSGVAVIPADELESRDMNVFDVIIVAHDMGTSPLNWGGGNPVQRAAAIAATGANVLAIGRGGAVFLGMAISGANYSTTESIDADRKYYAPSSAVIFTTPHAVPNPEVTIFDQPAPTVALNIASPYPAGVNLHASTGKACLGLCANDQWALADFRTLNTSSRPVIYFFSGYSGTPEDLNPEGRELFGNILGFLTTAP